MISFIAISLVLAIASTITASVAVVNAQIILEPSPNMASLNLNISFANNTNATLTNESITEEQGNLIVSAVNTVLAGLVEDLEDLELEEELEEIEEEEDSDSDSDSDNNNDNGNDNNNDDDDNNNGNNNNDNDGFGFDPIPIPEPIPEEEDEPEPEPEPEPEEPEPIPGPDENNSFSELELEIRTEGCPDDYGYYPDGKWICYPIDEDGELQTEYPKDMAFCAALGCPFNPPDL